MNNDKELCEPTPKATLFERMSLASMTEEQLRARIEALNARVAGLESGAMRLRACICEIVEARDEEDFERIIAAIDDARDEATLSALGAKP